MLLLVVFPTFDVLSDLVTLLQAKFFASWLFYCCVTCFFLSNLALPFYMWEKKWAPISPGEFINNGLSIFNQLFHPQVIDSPFHRAFTVVAYLLLLLVYFMYIPLVFAFGCILFQSKVIAVKTTQNLWLWLWNTKLVHANVNPDELEVDCDILSSSLMCEFLLETAPQLAFQIVNVIFMQEITFMNVFSIGFSALMLLRTSSMCFNRVVLMNRTLAEFIDTNLRMTSENIQASLNGETKDGIYYDGLVNAAARQQFMAKEEFDAATAPEDRLFYLLKTSVLNGTMNCYLTEHNVNDASKLISCELEILNGLIATYSTSLKKSPLLEGNTKLLKQVLEKRPRSVMREENGRYHPVKEVDVLKATVLRWHDTAVVTEDNTL